MPLPVVLAAFSSLGAWVALKFGFGTAVTGEEAVAAVAVAGAAAAAVAVDGVAGGASDAVKTARGEK